MLSRHKVAAWLAGHRHTNLNHCINEAGTIELITPGLVGNYGGFQCGYTLVHVYNDKLVYRFKPLAASTDRYEQGPLQGLLKPISNPISACYVWRPKK